MKLSQKITLMNLAVAIVLVIILLIWNYEFNYSEALKIEKTHSQQYSRVIASNLNRVLLEKIKTARSVAASPYIIKYVKRDNSFFETQFQDNISNEIIRKNKEWMETTDSNDPLVLKCTMNDLSEYLKSQLTLLPNEYGEIFVTNKYGAVVAATTKTTTFKHNNKYWWIGSYNDSKGAVFLDDRGYDESAKQVVLGIVVPVMSENEVIGIMKFNIMIENLIQDLITTSNTIFDGKILLVRSNGRIIWEKDKEPLSSKFEYFSMEQTRNNSERTFITNADVPALVGYSIVDITSNLSEHKFGGNFKSIDHNLGNENENWFIVVIKPLHIFRQRIFEDVRFFTIGFLLSILVITIFAYFLSSKITSSLKTISESALKIARGDFSSLPKFDGNDEVSILSNTINQVVDSLHNKNDLLEKIFDNIPALVFYKDDKNNFLMVNNYIARSHNKPKEWFVNRSLFDIYPKEMAQAYFDDDLAVINSDKPLIDREEIWNIEDGPKWVRTSKIPIVDSETGERTILGIASDITDRKILENKLIESENLYRNIFNNNSIMLFIDPENSMIIDANNFACNYYGYSHAEIVELKITDINIASPEQVVEEMRLVKTKQKNYLSFKHKLASGEIRDVEVYSGPIRIKDKEFLLSVIHDVTEKKRNEERIKEYIEEIKNINKKLENYSYTISHDLKEPIRSIISFSEFIKEDLGELLNEHTLDYFSRIVSASMKMKVMIDDLLLLSRVGKKDIEFIEVSLSDLINDVIFLFHQKIKDKNVNISIDEMPRIVCQPVWMRVIFQNLISNSIKFGDKETIIINIKYHENADYHEFTIRDNGQGIEENQYEKVFGLFRKAHQNKDIEGSGAGLSIVASVLDQHKGKVWVNWSNPGEGTEIKFTIFKSLT